MTNLTQLIQSAPQNVIKKYQDCIILPGLQVILVARGVVPSRALLGQAARNKAWKPRDFTIFSTRPGSKAIARYTSTLVVQVVPARCPWFFEKKHNTRRERSQMKVCFFLFWDVFFPRVKFFFSVLFFCLAWSFFGMKYFLRSKRLH